ncbi:MAG: 30S ribosomal protein S8 [Fimbriimonadales bacterium]|nr:30S ribosomal protein S8 [Fimbriimonadales bacterium]MDW8052221.1 30S ribosomal protein S8 [Armatimonadota bacterium]
MMTDPIADMLTRIRNGVMARKETVEVPGSRLKTQIAAILKQEGFIKDYEVKQEGVRSTLVIHLKYTPDGDPVIHHIQRISKPGQRIYASVEQLRPIRRGLGTAIVSTSQGLLTDRECRRRRIGGEVICVVW